MAWSSMNPVLDSCLANSVVLTAFWCLNVGEKTGGGCSDSSNTSLSPNAILPSFIAESCSTFVTLGPFHGISGSSTNNFLLSVVRDIGRNQIKSPSSGKLIRASSATESVSVTLKLVSFSSSKFVILARGKLLGLATE